MQDEENANLRLLLENKFNDIRDISVSQDEKMLFVLSGSKVYSITL